jgi:phosphatidylglycerophosphate synthase
LNWFGDSLDGTLARYRKIERPRYGFFVDHIIDSVDEVLVFIGLGISPYVRFEIASLALIMYLLLSIYVYLGTYVNGVFRIAYAGIGPTETRLLAIFANTIVFFTNNPLIRLSFATVTFYDILVIIITVVGLLIFTINAITMANDLSREDRIARREKIIEERQKRRMERIARQQVLREERSRRGSPNRITRLRNSVFKRKSA